MQPVVRILGHGAIALGIRGLDDRLRALLREALCAGSEAPPGPRERAAEILLAAPPDRLTHAVAAVREQGQGRIPEELIKKIETLLDNFLRSDYKIRCRDRVLDLGSRTHVMGILNVTPDSFSDGGRYLDAGRAVARGREMAAEGADIIDIGGESTRPGSEPVSEDEELARVLPVIRRLAADVTVPLSVDTTKSRVADQALTAGASIVNDISGLRSSPDMAKVAAGHGAAVVIMHIKGTPRDMQQDPRYGDVVADVMRYLEDGIGKALDAGVDREQLLIDPGIGFGKTLEHNLTLLNRLEEFKGLGRPLLLGTSRKKFIGAVLGVPVPEQRIEGTAATVALGIARGARVVRVHDVASMVKVARMTDAVLKQR